MPHAVTADTRLDRIPRATAREALATTAELLVPLVGRGLIARRPAMTGLADRLEADDRGVKRMQQLRERYGSGPVLVPTVPRPMALILDPDDVHRVLDGTPVPFSPATSEKRYALAHFQPEGALISDPDERAVRRAFNEAVLDTGEVFHRFSDEIARTVAEETAALLAIAHRRHQLRWSDFIDAWWRIVRRVVLGASARDDHAITDMLTELRHDANWSGLKPRNDHLRYRFFRQLHGHLDRAEPGSLAHLVATTPAAPGTEAPQQVPQWLFAYDPAGMATFRALALLSAHDDHFATAREEAGDEGAVPMDLPFLRASVLESLRLWPTTPGILRETTEETTWANGIMPAGTNVLIYAPFFHRDDQHLAFANSFAPEIWMVPRGTDDWPLVPFSGGPGMCPGRNLVLLTASLFLAHVLRDQTWNLPPDSDLRSGDALPATFDPFELCFRV